MRNLFIVFTIMFLFLGGCGLTGKEMETETSARAHVEGGGRAISFSLHFGETGLLVTMAVVVGIVLLTILIISYLRRTKELNSVVLGVERFRLSRRSINLAESIKKEAVETGVETSLHRKVKKLTGKTWKSLRNPNPKDEGGTAD